MHELAAVSEVDRLRELALFAGAGGGILGGHLLGWRTICAVECDTGERSGLWLEMARIIGEVRPRLVFVENSPVLTARGLDVVLGDLAALGFDARWGIVSAADVGAPHRRERIWIAADSSGVRLEGVGEPGESEEPCREIKKGNEAARTSRLVDECKCWVENEPEILGMVDGLAHRVDRFESIGNGQVPLVAATAWRILGGMKA